MKISVYLIATTASVINHHSPSKKLVIATAYLAKSYIILTSELQNAQFMPMFAKLLSCCLSTMQLFILVPVIALCKKTSSCIPDWDFREPNQGYEMSSYMWGVRRLSSMTLFLTIFTSWRHFHVSFRQAYKTGAVPDFSWSKNVVILA